MKPRGNPIPLAVVIIGTAIALSAQPQAAPSQAPGLADDRTISAGLWDIAAVEWDGKPVDTEFLKLLQVSYAADGSWAVLFRNRPVVEGRSTNHQDDSPKTFEMETLGSERIPPSRFAGIYRLEGDTRVLCIVSAGKPRPREFSATKRSGRMLVTLKRPPP